MHRFESSVWAANALGVQKDNYMYTLCLYKDNSLGAGMQRKLVVNTILLEVCFFLSAFLSLKWH